MMRLKKDGTPAKKPGRPRTRPIPVKKGPAVGPRPHTWYSGPEERRHSMYMPWNRAKAQANFRKEAWDLTFEQFYEIWKDDWEKRGRQADDLCMTREDPDGAWDIKNTVLVTRHEHLKRQGQYRIEKGMKYYKKGPPGKKSKPIEYTKTKKGK